MVHYKTLSTLFRDARKWEPGEFIDIEGHHPYRPPFRGQPLIVIDPVDPKRNVAAVISPENFMKFVNICRLFVEKPSERFFFRKKAKPRPEKLARIMDSRKSLFLAVEFAKPGVIDDVLYPQLRRTSRRLQAILKDREFALLGEGVFSGRKKCVLLFEMEVWELPLVRKIRGPPVFVRKHAGEFIEKYKKGRLWVEGDIWTAEIKREFPLAEDLLRKTLRQKAGKLREMGIASYMAKSISGGFRILKGREIVRKAKSQDFFEFLADYLERRISRPAGRGS
jgi:tRNA nucleotidyltransferase (CCA-adding enzyme)